MVPTIHLNGTDRDSLVNDIIDVRSKLFEALEAMRKVTPNGRDYYPQGPDAIHHAMVEHHARVAQIQAVMDELGTLAEAISDAPQGGRP